MSKRLRHVLYPMLWAVLLVLGTTLFGSGHQGAQAQNRVGAGETATPHWELWIDGESAAWPEQSPSVSLDSVQAVGRRALHQLRREGYYYAQIDSVTVDSSALSPTVRLYVSRGPQVSIEQLQITEVEALSAQELRGHMQTREGAPLVPGRLEADIQVLLDEYEEAGYPLAQVRIAETRLTAGEEPGLLVTLKVDEGPALWLKGIDLPEGVRTSPRLLAHLADLEVGATLRNYDPEAIQQSLRNAHFLQEVGTPELRVDSEGGAVLHVPVTEEPPGAFDAVLGYLPPSGPGQSGQMVGSGHLLLEHLFGRGRRAELTLDRRQGQTSIFEALVADPYLFQLPLRLEGQFRGEQRDSTYGKRTYRLDLGYRVGTGVEATVSFSREVVRPGQAGTNIRRRRQHIPRSTGHFYGVGVQYRQRDRKVNPRRGLVVEVHAEQGRKRRRGDRILAGGDTSRVHETVRQERFQSRLRAYLPLSARQVLAFGGEASVLLSKEYDQSDLFRMGGAASLRGYDEDRFLGNVTARGLLEYRFQLDRQSYAFAFGDLGYVERPRLDRATAQRGWHPGYGIGLQMQTGLGRVTTTYALSPEAQTPAHGRVHLGLSVGL